jgi:hypothetical protein
VLRKENIRKSPKKSEKIEASPTNRGQPYKKEISRATILKPKGDDGEKRTG